MKQTRLINNIIGGSYESDERIAGCAVSMNLYAESVEEASNGFYFTSSLRSVEGERVVLDLSDIQDQNKQGCRGIFVASDDSIFAAFGRSVLRIKYNSVRKSYNYEIIYTQNYETIGRVNFAETGGVNSHVIWIDGDEFIKAYPIDTSSAEDAGIPIPQKFRTPLRVYLTSGEIKYKTNEHVKPNSICSIAGCIAINDPENDTWYYTDPYILGGTNYTRTIYELDADGNVQYESGSSYKVKTKEVSLNAEDPSSLTSYLWLDRYSKPRFQTAEYSADVASKMIRCGDFLFVFGSKSLQIYDQRASTDAQGFSTMVFSSTGRNVQDLGTNDPDTVVELNGNVIFLGSSSRGERSIWFTNGGVPQRISTSAIEREIEGGDTYGASALCFNDNGHSFYCITFPRMNKSYCYDFATRQWHNRSTRISNGQDVEWWATYAVNANGSIMVAGKNIEKLAVLDKNKFDDFRGQPIIKRRTTPVIMSDYSPFIINDLQIMWNTGTTRDVTNSFGARDPVVMLEVSTDGGNTYGSERWAYGGKTGEYGHRSIWYGIGAGTMFVFRFTISDRVNVVITGAKISHTRLSHF